MTVVLAPEAEADLLAAIEYLRARNASAATRLAERVVAGIQTLAEGDVDGPEHRLKTGAVVRSWLIPPFRLFYRRKEGELQVLRLYHHSRRPIVQGPPR